jgi:hypothetical protein
MTIWGLGLPDDMFYVALVFSVIILCALMALFNALLDRLQERFEQSEEMLEQQESSTIAAMSDPKKRLQAVGRMRQGPGMGDGEGKGLRNWLSTKRAKIKRIAAGHLSSSDSDEEDPMMAREMNKLRVMNVSAPHQKGWRKVVKAIACMAECGGRCGNIVCAQTITHLTTCKLHHCDRCIRLRRLTALHANYCHLRVCRVPGCRALRDEGVEELVAERQRRKRKPRVTIVRAEQDVAPRTPKQILAEAAGLPPPKK